MARQRCVAVCSGLAGFVAARRSALPPASHQAQRCVIQAVPRVSAGTSCTGRLARQALLAEVCAVGFLGCVTAGLLQGSWAWAHWKHMLVPKRRWV